MASALEHLAFGYLSGTSVTISGFSSSYSDLIIEVDGYHSGSSDILQVRVNGDSGGGSYTYMYFFSNTDGASVMELYPTFRGSSSSNTTQYQLTFPSYSTSTGLKKAMVCRAGAVTDFTASVFPSISHSYWQNTSNITSVTLLAGNSMGGTYNVYGRL